VNDMDLTRQILLALVILVATTHVIAAECSADEAQQLREACQQSLQDIRGTRRAIVKSGVQRLDQATS
jgi:hypothetical protein